MTGGAIVWTCVIGTRAECDLRVADPLVSGQHCQVVKKTDGSLWVADLGSLNGTWLKAIQRLEVFGARVRMHDEIRVVAPARWRAGWTLWVGRSGLELDGRGWVRAVNR